MTEQYTPTTEEVREVWEYHLSEGMASEAVKYDANWDTDRLLAQFDRWLAKRDAEVAAKALEDFAENLNLHTNIPDEWDTELIFPLCDDDECLFWDMTHDLAKALRARASEYRKAVQ